MSGYFWTPDDIELLKKLNSEGKTAAQVGVVLGMTSRAVSNKLHSLGVKSGYKQPRKPKKPRLLQAKPAPVKIVPIAAPIFQSVTLDRRTGCCFPLNDGGPFLFCNAPGDARGASLYCEYHWQAMHNSAAQHHPRSVRSALKVAA